jgi:hypothetical protein
MKALKWHKPSNVSIKPQRMGFTFDADKVPDKWLYNNAFLTTWMESLSILFPEGEQFFVDAVRQVRGSIDDKEIQSQISGFIGQEAMHSLEHVAMNNYLDAKGLPAAELEKTVVSLLKVIQKYSSAKDQLALTAALEHITAMLANLLLEENEFSEAKRRNMHESMRSLWMWHAIEETEHKGVAYDVYLHVGAPYWHRTLAMLIATLGLGVMSNYYHVRMLANSKTGFKLKDMLFGIKSLYGINGYVTRLAPVWLSYFKPGFHPWDDDNSALIDRWKGKVLQAADPKYIKVA